MKNLLLLTMLLLLFVDTNGQKLNLNVSTGIKSEDFRSSQVYTDFPLDVSMEYFPIDMFSLSLGYEKFSDGFDEFDNVEYLFKDIGSYQHFSYSLYKIGITYYPLLLNKHSIGIGAFIGSAVVTNNKTTSISYISTISNPLNEEFDKYRVDIILSDFRKKLLAYSFEFGYFYNIIPDRLNAGFKIDYTTFNYEDNVKYYLPELVGFKITLGVVI